MILNYLKTFLQSVKRQKGFMFLNFMVLIVSMIVLTILISTFSELIFTPHYNTQGKSLYFLENPANKFPESFSKEEKQRLLKVEAPVNWCLLSDSPFSFHPSKKGILKDFEGRYANENYLNILDLNFIKGERYNQKYIESGQRVIVISETVAEYLFESTDVIGKEVLVFRIPYKVVGVFKNMSRIAPTTAVAFLPVEFSTWEKMEWNVPIQRYLATCGPTTLAILSFISRAALLVKVSARMEDGGTLFWSKWAIRYVKTLVLPEPAPAMISEGPSKFLTACCWASFRLSR